MFDLRKHFEKRVSQFELECARLARSGCGREDVVALGDSLTEVNKGTPGWVNRGIFADHLSWPDCDAFERLGTNRLHPNPRAIVVFLGINDLNDNPKNVARLVALYGYLLATLSKLHPNARLAATSLLPTDGPATHLNRPVTEFNEKIRELASARGILFLDLHRCLYDSTTGQAKPHMLLKGDGIHVSRSGYRIINAYYASRHKELLGNSHALDISIDSERLSHDLLAVAGRPAWATQDSSTPDATLIARLIKPEVDYLLLFARTSARVFMSLYLGSRNKLGTGRTWQDSDAGGRARSLAMGNARLWEDCLSQQGIDGKDGAALLSAYRSLEQHLTDTPSRRLKLLFIGDSLLLDVELMLGGLLLQEGLSIAVDHIFSNDLQELQSAIQTASRNQYDGIVYSPLSWEFDQDAQNVLGARPLSPRALDKTVQCMASRVRDVLRLVAGTFDCNIYLHNTAAVIHSTSDRLRTIRSLVTLPKRHYVRKQLGAQIATMAKELNLASSWRVYLVDELAAAAALHDDLSLGRPIYEAEGVFRSELGFEVSRQLALFLSVATRLAGRRAVICALDNTLWDGVVGEGPDVRQRKDKQRILLELKQAGICLAICSHNETAELSWDGAVMSPNDFVVDQAVVGDSKCSGIPRLLRRLEATEKNAVFMDARAEERAVVARDYPGIECFDPCCENTWELLQTWARLCPLGQTKPGS